MIRKGASSNPMVFPESDYNNTAFGFSNGQYTFSHTAYGADRFRYSANFGRNWSTWTPIEDMTFIDSKLFDDPFNFWEGQHIMVQCEFAVFSFRIDTEQCRRLERLCEICQRCRSCRSRLQATAPRTTISCSWTIQFVGFRQGDSVANEAYC